MMKNNKLFYGILIVVLIVLAGGLFILNRPTTAPTPKDQTREPKEYYGNSTYGRCQQNNDCYISGCNSEICQSKAEDQLVSICILPDKPTPKQLNYVCQCAEQKCQWSK